MKKFIYDYLRSNPNNRVFIYQNHYGSIPWFNVFFLIGATFKTLFYKALYLFAYSYYYMPYLKRIINTTYKDEFHTDLDSRFTELSWLDSKHYDQYQTALINARNRSHEYNNEY